MAELSHEMLDRFERALAVPGFNEIENIRSAFKLLPHHDTYGTPPADICHRLLRIMDAMIIYQPNKRIEMAYNYSNEDWIRAIAAGNIEGLLRGGEYWRRKQPHLLPISTSEILTALTHWAAHQRHSAANILNTYWRALENQSQSMIGVMQVFVAEQENSGAANLGTGEAMIGAQAFKLQLEKDHDWPENKTKAFIHGEILPLLDSDFAVKRELGGLLIGEIMGLASEQEWQTYGLPSRTAMFELIGTKHRANGNIAAGFIHGARLEIEPLSTFSEFALDDGFDWEDWLLDLYCNSEGDEAIIGQPLWFPIHEHFSFNVEAAMRLVDHGKYFAAKMTAEED